MTQEMILNLGRVINTLNHIDVKGKDNLAGLAGCIGVLEEMYAKLVAPPDDKADTEAS